MIDPILNLTLPRASVNVTHDYTVILLYPDYVSGSDVETYAVDIHAARHPHEAVDKARWQCLLDNSWVDDEDKPEHEPEDFVPLYIFNGIAPPMTFTNYDRVAGAAEVPARACVGCGNGLWPSNEGSRCEGRCRTQ